VPIENRIREATMTRRTTVLPLLVALLLGAIGWASASQAAYAGGPTSVLMTNPNLGRATALHVQNPDYDRLYAAVGEEVTGPEQPPTGVGSSDEVRLTWLIHDMQIWRIDRVHLTPDDGIWLETVINFTDSGDVFDRPARWHRPKDGHTLTVLLSTAGLLVAGPAPSTASDPGGSPQLTEAASAPAQPVAPILGAAIGGLLIGSAGSLLLRRRRPAADRPRVTLTG
jgi:hypothetical protein